MKQTAIQNLVMELEQFAKFPMVDRATIEAAIDFAKIRLETEKDQIIDAHDNGYIDGGNKKDITAEKYYQETYGK
jgi:hypothetical protein